MRAKVRPDMAPQYQTFDDARGHSDSAAKLASLRLPRLTGKSVLDIACNEGFFCQQAWRLGATRVVGIDKSEAFIERARKRDPRTEYRQMDWSLLPELDETFDVILLLSALHYSKDPSATLQMVVDRLAPDGMLLLECGVAPGREPKWVPVDRPRGDRVLHPTRAMVLRAVPHTVVRKIGASVQQGGDPIPRAVFRITRQKPTVLLVAGESGSGKTTLLRTLTGRGRHAGVSLDYRLATLPSWSRDEALLDFMRNLDIPEQRLGAQLGDVSQRLVEAGLEERFIEEVVTAERRKLQRFPVTVIEGYLLACGNVAEVFAERLTRDGAFTWHVHPSETRPRLLGGERPQR